MLSKSSAFFNESNEWNLDGNELVVDGDEENTSGIWGAVMVMKEGKGARFKRAESSWPNKKKLGKQVTR